MQDDQSCTQWLELLKAGEQDAAANLWTRFFRRLVGLATRKLAAGPKRIADEEDVAISAFHSFCRGAAAGNFAKLENRDDLWQVLAVITTRKALRQLNKERAQKRGGANVRGESIFANNDGRDMALQDLATSAPTPEFIAIADEQVELLINLLPDDSMRAVAQAKLQGYTNDEIAQMLQRHPRSVERKLKLIREHWMTTLDRDSDG